MTDLRYADPELLVAEWLHGQLSVKTWADPELPERWDYTAPLVWIQRGQGSGDTVLTLDDVLLDVAVLAKIADNARETAELVRREIRLNLPLTTFDNGVFCTGSSTFSAPSWAPATGVFRREATYRVILHGVV